VYYGVLVLSLELSDNIPSLESYQICKGLDRSFSDFIAIFLILPDLNIALICAKVQIVCVD
jgi:hypothetical protein